MAGIGSNAESDADGEDALDALLDGYDVQARRERGIALARTGEEAGGSQGRRSKRMRTGRGAADALTTALHQPLTSDNK